MDHVESFPEQQIRLAKRAADESINLGHRLLENVQGELVGTFLGDLVLTLRVALLIICWWYWCRSK